MVNILYYYTIYRDILTIPINLQKLGLVYTCFIAPIKMVMTVGWSIHTNGDASELIVTIYGEITVH